jgi:anti-sigma regulatory factor (Ser/Thr protein kinase)
VTTLRSEVNPMDGSMHGLAPWPAVGAARPQCREKTMADNWPLHSHLELGALPSAVPCARLHARQLIWEWGFNGVINDVELLVSELVTNAVRASLTIKRDLPIRLWLLSDNVRVVVSVWDGNPRPPVRVDAIEDAESGRGLVLVEALSDKWDWFAHKSLGGKVVWCEISRGPVVNGRDLRADR